MDRIDNQEISFDEFDEINSPRPAGTDFDQVAERFMSRRSFLRGSLAVGASAFVLGTGTLTSRQAEAAAAWLKFEPVKANSMDAITVPNGFSSQVVARWGDPLWTGAADFDHATRGTGESSAKAFGDNNDGMDVFSGPNGETILAVNNEYTNRSITYGNRESKLPENADDVLKGKNLHGITVMEIAQNGGKWSIVKDSKYNRRITADSPMDLTGPAAGHDWLKTEADPTGTKSLGTWNNCGNGMTPWGTYLTCEENFNGYFSSSEQREDQKPIAQTPAFVRYGIKEKDWGYAWATADDRFDTAKHPNEPNRAGYVVEIDPLDPSSTPKKRTALGRFKHENAEVVVASDGHVVVYLGDDERGEFLYKFVSAGRYSEGGNNANLLEDGELYAARFRDDGTGEWVHLTPASTGMPSKAEICIHTRMAGSAVGATTMDRPEWVAVNPMKAEGYCCLTNNKNRGVKPNAGGDDTSVNGPNPREKNKYGQIVRWEPVDGNHSSAAFKWDLFVIAGNPAVHNDAYAGSKNVTAANMFNSPDGLKFDTQGGLWIQTDGNYSNAKDFAGQGNNQMLFADTNTGEIKRFLVGPKECEITGLTWSADKKTMFVGVQHPGEKGDSHWPEGGDAVPRSAIVAITRNDGGVIG
jgi:secreted PhoX family phosphatase